MGKRHRSYTDPITAMRRADQERKRNEKWLASLPAGRRNAIEKFQSILGVAFWVVIAALFCGLLIVMCF
jgi:hypothetical protein